MPIAGIAVSMGIVLIILGLIILAEKTIRDIQKWRTEEDRRRADAGREPLPYREISPFLWPDEDFFTSWRDE